jgi:PAS domain S-box-containing protein
VSEAIDSLKALTEELATQELSASILENLPDALVIINDQGRIVRFNKQAEFIFGYHRSEVIGQLVHILLPERLRAVHGEHLIKFMLAPRSRPMGQDQALLGCHKSGREFSVAINLNPTATSNGLVVVAVVRME